MTLLSPASVLHKLINSCCLNFLLCFNYCNKETFPHETHFIFIQDNQQKMSEFQNCCYFQILSETCPPCVELLEEQWHNHTSSWQLCACPETWGREVNIHEVCNNDYRDEVHEDKLTKDRCDTKKGETISHIKNIVLQGKLPGQAFNVNDDRKASPPPPSSSLPTASSYLKYLGQCPPV